jgi:hypothetical protein
VFSNVSFISRKDTSSAMSEETLKNGFDNLEMLTLLPFQYDEQTVGDIVTKQVELVGGLNLFYRLDQSLKDMRIEPLFIEEQWVLYHWRCKFFEDHFPDGFGGIDRMKKKIESLSFLVCCKFDQVASLAIKCCSDVMDDREKEEFNEVCVEALSRHDKWFSIASVRRFETDFVSGDLCMLLHEKTKEDFCHRILFAFRYVESYPISFDEIAAMITEFYPSQVKQVKSLEDIA